jgi:serralysin
MMKRLIAAALFVSVSAPALSADLIPWRMTSGSNWNNGYAPGNLGFNLADVSSLSILNLLPEGVKGLVYVGGSNGGCSGDSPQFRAFVDQFKGNAKLWGFYLMDEPYGRQVGSTPACPMINLKAETDYVHANFPGISTFVKLGNIGSTTKPDYMDFSIPGMLDVYGVGGYPCRTANAGPDKCEYEMIDRYVKAALDAHIPREKMAPTYQAFGGWDNVFVVPSSAQMQKLLDKWHTLLPSPPMSFAYSYGQQPKSTSAISTNPALQAVFRDWNATQTTPPEPEPEPPVHPEGPESCVPCCK